MNIAGNKLEYKDITDVVVFKKGTEEVVFTIKAVFDEEVVDKMVPEPEPPIIRFKGKKSEADVADTDYLSKIRERAEIRVAYRIIESLSATPDLTWDTVNMDDPTTWKNWESEMSTSGFSQHEIDFLVTKIVHICGMSVGAMEEARKDFLASEPVEDQPL